jgi:hypothetical protein
MHWHTQISCMVKIHVWLSSSNEALRDGVHLHALWPNHEAVTDGVHHHALQSHLYEGDGQFVALHHIMLVHTPQLSGKGYGDGYIHVHWCHVFHIKCLCGRRHWLAYSRSQDCLLPGHCRVINTGKVSWESSKQPAWVRVCVTRVGAASNQPVWVWVRYGAITKQLHSGRSSVSVCVQKVVVLRMHVYCLYIACVETHT